MKAKDVILDFTPLLDITLIILFYFILFSNFSGENTAAADKMNKAESLMSQADSKLAEAESMMDEAKSIQQQAEDKLAMLEAADADAAALAEALAELNDGENIRMIYDSEGIGTGQWTVTVKKGENTLRTFEPDNIHSIEDEMKKVLAESGYDNDSYIFISYIYENIDITPKNKIDRMFDAIKEEYPGHIFVSETNTSKEEQP